MRFLVAALPLAIVLISGCSSVQPIGGNQASSIPEGLCNVTVYNTEAQARRNGNLEEVCIIEGTSSGSFFHTTATAIAKHKDKACGCGVDNVYVQSRQPMGMSVASVSMVAFRYIEGANEKMDDEILRKARLCQDRDGVWVNDSCMVEID